MARQVSLGTAKRTSGVIIWTTTHTTQSHRGKDQDKKEPHADLGLLAETEAHGWLACVQATPEPGLVGLFCEKRTILWTNVVRSLPTFCFRWLQLLVSGLAVVFAVQAAARAPTPQSFDGVLRFFCRSNTLPSRFSLSAPKPAPFSNP
jgi:hypothetical protein